MLLFVLSKDKNISETDETLMILKLFLFGMIINISIFA
jgi:hypothetical protein